MRLFRFPAAPALLLAMSAALSACSYFRPAPEIRFAEPAAVGVSAEGLAGIDAALQPFVDSGKNAGFVTLVARDGQVVHLSAIGQRDVENSLPMETGTIFRMFSMTKPITAVAVMQQVEQGKVSVSDPVSKYIPEFAEMKVLKVKEDGTHELVPAQTTMTVEHLLTHTSGLSYGMFNPTIEPYYTEAGLERYGDITLEEFARSAAKVPLLFEPGTGWEYSIAMDILGRIVEITSGLPFDAYLEENIFAPLGMEDSGFWVPADKLDRFAALYNMTEDKKGMTRDDGPRSDYSSAPAMASGGGGMVGTAGDYFRFAQALLGGGEFEGVRILGEEAAAEIVADHIAHLGASPLKLGNFPLMNLGFGYCGSVVREGASPVFGSPGSYWWGGYASTDFWIDPQENLVAILCTQLIPAGGQPTRIVFSQAVYKAITKKADLAAAAESADAELAEAPAEAAASN